MPWRLQSEPTVTEKILGGLCYPTFGIVGLIYILLKKDSSQSQIFRFHFIQSILLWIIAMLVGMAAGTLVPLLVAGLAWVVPRDLLVNMDQVIGWGAIVINNAFYLLLAYGAIFAFLGKYAEVPFISHVVRQNMR
jgi:uncharacterized membrane protein